MASEFAKPLVFASVLRKRRDQAGLTHLSVAVVLMLFYIVPGCFLNG